MPDGPPFRSSLSEFLASEVKTASSPKAGVHLTEKLFGHLNLRGGGADAAFLSGVQRPMGLPLPLEPNTTSRNDSTAALWLGPDEWLLITPLGDEVAVAAGLRQALEGLFFAVTDITHGQTVIRLSGPKARDVLGKGCSLDLHPKTFGPGRCAQTLLAKVGVTIRWVNDRPSLDLIVRRSFAEYLALWLGDAAGEYGFTAAS